MRGADHGRTAGAAEIMLPRKFLQMKYNMIASIVQQPCSYSACIVIVIIQLSKSLPIMFIIIYIIISP